MEPALRRRHLARVLRQPPRLASAPCAARLKPARRARLCAFSAVATVTFVSGSSRRHRPAEGLPACSGYLPARGSSRWSSASRVAGSQLQPHRRPLVRADPRGERVTRHARRPRAFSPGPRALFRRSPLRPSSPGSRSRPCWARRTRTEARARLGALPRLPGAHLGRPSPRSSRAASASRRGPAPIAYAVGALLALCAAARSPFDWRLWIVAIAGRRGAPAATLPWAANERHSITRSPACRRMGAASATSGSSQQQGGSSRSTSRRPVSSTNRRAA
jgi:hypothetical protein